MKTTAVPYWQKLQDPRWQKKRLEILQRDEWMCRDCGDSTTQLQVHHEYYISGRQPWEYPDGAFLTLCSSCHSERRKNPLGVRDWEVFCRLENEHVQAVGNPLDLIQCLDFLSKQSGITTHSILMMVEMGVYYGIIDHETLVQLNSRIRDVIHREPTELLKQKDQTL